MKIVPSVGRVVWFFSRKLKNTEPLPALVTAVIDEDHVNLAGFMADGKPLGDGLQNVPNIDAIPDKPEHKMPDCDFWAWMPFQKGQAQKTDDTAGLLKEALARLEKFEDRLKAVEAPASVSEVKKAVDEYLASLDEPGQAHAKKGKN